MPRPHGNVNPEDVAAQRRFNRNVAGALDAIRSRRVDVPATATDPGQIGDWAVESGFVYFCVDTDIWERVAIATF